MAPKFSMLMLLLDQAPTGELAIFANVSIWPLRHDNIDMLWYITILWQVQKEEGRIKYTSMEINTITKQHQDMNAPNIY